MLVIRGHVDAAAVRGDEPPDDLVVRGDLTNEIGTPDPK